LKGIKFVAILKAPKTMPLLFIFAFIGREVISGFRYKALQVLISIAIHYSSGWYQGE
jgi:hypothetical protein